MTSLIALLLCLLLATAYVAVVGWGLYRRAHRSLHETKGMVRLYASNNDYLANRAISLKEACASLEARLQVAIGSIREHEADAFRRSLKPPRQSTKPAARKGGKRKKVSK